MAWRVCLDCGRLHRNPSRCDECTAKRSRDRGSATARGYGADWRRVRTTVLANWRALSGDWCPGYRVLGHASSDLTVDHIVPLAKGGTHDVDNLAVLCRACNSRKHDRLL